MNAQVGLERCLAFIGCQLKSSDGRWHPEDAGSHLPAVTLSRQTGSGGHIVAEELANFLQAFSPPGIAPWTVFDRNLVEKILEDHHLPGRLARFMPEDRISEISDTMEEMFGLHPSSWNLVHKATETVLRLAELGHVILVGRGAQVITRKLPYVFHVRLVGSLSRRIAHIQEIEHLSLKAARELVLAEDQGRRRYLKKYFGKDIDDPLLYHLVVNTDRMTYEGAAHLIGEAVMSRRIKVGLSN
jgi:cytidylate kinase